SLSKPFRKSQHGFHGLFTLEFQNAEQKFEVQGSGQIERHLNQLAIALRLQHPSITCRTRNEKRADMGPKMPEMCLGPTAVNGAARAVMRDQWTPKRRHSAWKETTQQRSALHCGRGRVGHGKAARERWDQLRLRIILTLDKLRTAASLLVSMSGVGNKKITE